MHLTAAISQNTLSSLEPKLGYFPTTWKSEPMLATSYLNFISDVPTDCMFKYLTWNLARDG